MNPLYQQMVNDPFGIESNKEFNKEVFNYKDSAEYKRAEELDKNFLTDPNQNPYYEPTSVREMEKEIDEMLMQPHQINEEELRS